MLDIPSISTIIAAIGVIIGVVLTVLEIRNLVDTRQTDLVIRLYSTFGSKEVQDAWEKIKPIAEGERKQTNRPQIWEWFEYLYNEMQKREQQLQQPNI